MSHDVVYCMKCGEMMRVPYGYLGEPFDCPFCGHEFEI